MAQEPWFNPGGNLMELMMEKKVLRPGRETEEQVEAAKALLTEHGYRVSRPFEPRAAYCEEPAPSKLMKAAILDTETTGTNPQRDKIIELGIVVVEYDPETGQAYRVLETFNELEDPGFPIPPESTKIHNITDEMVAGKQIDDAAVATLMEGVSLVVAHNAAFDRAFMERRFPLFERKPWGCSFAQMDWNNEGLGSAKLEFLAYRCGFHYTGHRASVDCHALLEVLQWDLPTSGVKALKRLLENARVPDIKVWAMGSPFESKDLLRERGYRWAAERKLWYKAIRATAMDEEVGWLKASVYNGKSFQLELEKVSAMNRFSERRGAVEVVKY